MTIPAARKLFLTTLPTRGVESAIMGMIKGLADYIDSYPPRYETKVGEDYILGDYVLDIVKGIRGLLNGETGRLDCGTIDRLLLDLVTLAGFDADNREGMEL